METNNAGIQSDTVWISDQLPNVVKILMGQSPPSSSYNKSKQGLPFFQGNKDFGDKYPTITAYTTEPKKISEKGDVLISVRAPIGDVNLSSETCCIGRGLAALRPNGEIDSLFLYYFAQTIKNYLENKGTGTTFAGISKDTLESVVIFYPRDVSVQKELALRIENLLTLNSNTCSNIMRAREKVSKFRQAILTAAITGKLTEKWRDKNEDIETATKLFEKIQAQRKIKSKAPSTVIDTQGLSPLPDKWIYVFFGDIVDDFKYGTSEKSDYSYKGTPVLRIPNVISQKISIDDLKNLEKQETKEEYLAKDGDILIVRSNGSRDLVGKHALVSGLKGDYAFASYLIRIRPNVVLPAYMSILLNSNLVRQQLFSNSKSAAGINNINTQELASMIVSLPPLREQEEIIEKVNQYFQVANNVEKQIEKAEANLSRLTQAILGKTFRGENYEQ